MARKLIDFDPETLQALELLSRDSGKTLQQLSDEAFSDLLTKHHRPRTLKDALKQSAKPIPANEKAKRRPNSLGGCSRFRISEGLAAVSALSFFATSALTR
jgi:hypothetical protein